MAPVEPVAASRQTVPHEKALSKKVYSHGHCIFATIPPFFALHSVANRRHSLLEKKKKRNFVLLSKGSFIPSMVQIR